MAIDPISRVGGAVATSVGEFATLTHTSLAHAALVLAQAKASASLAQRADDGSPTALSQLAAAEKQQVPLASQQLLPAPAQPSTPVQEPGKGILIDVYD